MKEDSKRLLALIHDFNRVRAQFRPDKFSMSEIMTMIAIEQLSEAKRQKGDFSGVKVSDISKKLETSKPDVSKKIKQLEEKKLVKRSDSVSDKRVTFIELTELGEKELLQGRTELEHIMQNVLDRMGEEKAKEFISLYEIMLRAMVEESRERKKV